MGKKSPEALRRHYERRTARLHAAGRCHCSRPLDPGMKTCSQCRANIKRRWLEKRADGLCGCGRAQPEDGLTMCAVCILGEKRRAVMRHYEAGPRRCCQCNNAAASWRSMYCGDCAEARARQSRARDIAANSRAWAALKAEVFAGYGNRCACHGCGVTEQQFLTIDHVGGGGSKHAQRLTGDYERRYPQATQQLYKLLKRQGFPRGYRLLCYNCNHAHGQYGRCPHERGLVEVDDTGQAYLFMGAGGKPVAA